MVLYHNGSHNQFMNVCQEENCPMLKIGRRKDLFQLTLT